MLGARGLPSPTEALPGRSEVTGKGLGQSAPGTRAVLGKVIALGPATHAVSGNPTVPPFPAEMQAAIFGMGCFWGVKQLFWELPGVFSTQVGYAGGFTPNPNYEEMCTGLTGHAEVVRVIFDPQKISSEKLFKVFWEYHGPTQGMQQQEDVGTQYRSVICTLGPQQQAAALCSRDAYQQELREQQHGDTTTVIEPAAAFYYTEGYHQQYLHKVPRGYCGLKGTGVTCPLASGEATSCPLTCPHVPGIAGRYPHVTGQPHTLQLPTSH
ncbi:peptide methionine sulfoxide reductase MsrA-like [Indicator indicator]|uniref:peptide methionine sulfoxide reductase MsrA-like n=1 Tax=Indicator indicator TaxID=1002788 RepID=UPI0023DF44C9|nr:peptide methionine sulfoxide reductase MsrA-like [Indicator indicator]